MSFVHQRETLHEGDVVIVYCSKLCNIRLMNDANFRRYKNNVRHTYYGGAFDRFPAKIKVPSSGEWNITVDTMTRKATSVQKKASFDCKIKIQRNTDS